MEWLTLFTVAMFGLSIGSFLNVVIYRTPKDESLLFPASKCQSCSTPLKWWHNIPLVSWLILRGKCHFCNAPISMQYPIVEFLTGVLFVLLYLKLGLVWQLFFVALSFSALLALVMIDFEYMAVPDSVNFVALLFALIQPNFVDALLYGGIAAGGLYLVGLTLITFGRTTSYGRCGCDCGGYDGSIAWISKLFCGSFFVRDFSDGSSIGMA